MRVRVGVGWTGWTLFAILCAARPAEAAGGDTCASATAIAALPYSDSLVTTCGFADDTNNTGAASCSELPSTYPGPDTFYRLDLGAGNSIAISVDLPPGATGDLAVFLLRISACGGAASCANQSIDVIGAGQGPERIKAKAYPPGTYYVVVDSINALTATSACGGYSLSVSGSLGVPTGAGGAGGFAGTAGVSGAGGTGIGGAGALGSGGVTATGGTPAGGAGGIVAVSSGGLTGGPGGSPSTAGTSGTLGVGGGTAGHGAGSGMGGGSGGAVSSGGASAGSDGTAGVGAGGHANGGTSSTGGAASLGGTSGAAGAGGTLAGAAGTSGAAGTKGAGGTAGHVEGGTDSATTDSSSGCSCETTGHGSNDTTLLTALSLGLCLSLPRRRRPR